MAIPALAAHISGVELMYCDNQYYELCGQMGHLIGPSSIGKGQFPNLIEAIMRSFRAHDKIETDRLLPPAAKGAARTRPPSAAPGARTSASTTCQTRK